MLKKVLWRQNSFESDNWVVPVTYKIFFRGYFWTGFPALILILFLNFLRLLFKYKETLSLYVGFSHNPHFLGRFWPKVFLAKINGLRRTLSQSGLCFESIDPSAFILYFWIETKVLILRLVLLENFCWRFIKVELKRLSIYLSELRQVFLMVISELLSLY